MCSLLSFGEINIPSSRAFWDDCDEDEINDGSSLEKLQLEFEPSQSDKPFACEIFFLIEGQQICEFAEKTFLQINNATKLCKIPCLQKKALNSALYKIEPRNILLAVIEEELTSSGEIMELLLPYAELAKDVVTFTIKPKMDYKTENIKEVRECITFLRGINGKLSIPELETPNFITGVSAGIASYREIHKMPVSSYVAYSDKIPLDTMAARAVLKSLKELGLECASSYKPKFRELSHLYS